MSCWETIKQIASFVYCSMYGVEKQSLVGNSMKKAKGQGPQGRSLLSFEFFLTSLYSGQATKFVAGHKTTQLMHVDKWEGRMIDDRVLLEILIEWAESGSPKSYTDLSNAYQKITGVWHEPYGSWDVPLGKLNNQLAEKGAPAISSLVILKEANEPGGNFWDCAPNVPERPKDEISRLAELNKIWKAVFCYDWRKNY